MDFKPDKPIYQHIADFCLNNILSGKWQPGEKIPSVRELSAQLAVNTHTVLKALEYLQQAAIIAPRRGMGFYLADDAREMVNRHRRQQFFDETLPTLVSEMKILGITPDELLSHLKQ